MNCDLCRIGRYRQTTTTYLGWLDDQMIVVPHAPTHKCDTCGHMKYNDHFVSALQTLLDQLTDGANGNEPEKRQLILDKLSVWQATRGSR